MCIISSQAIGKSRIYNLLESQDVINALKSIKKLGIKYKKFKKYYEISGYGLAGYNTKKKIQINAGNSGTLARLIMGLLIDAKKEVTIMGDNSLSRRDFSRVTEPLTCFGANIISKKKKLPVNIRGSDFLRPINYEEKIGSAQCKSAVMLAALKTPGITKINAKKSRNHTEILFKEIGIPIKVKSYLNHDYIELRGLINFKSFNYIVPGDISLFFYCINFTRNNSKLKIKNININSSRTGIIKILNK